MQKIIYKRIIIIITTIIDLSVNNNKALYGLKIDIFVPLTEY